MASVPVVLARMVPARLGITMGIVTARTATAAPMTTTTTMTTIDVAGLRSSGQSGD
ncbi:MAG TPA: hypothetical protein VHX65_08975 [Pirellulales bacterium]|nr:hypothetical protein [Pirellulales bacterium]